MKIICKLCGGHNDSRNLECEYCGTPLPQPKPNSATSVKPYLGDQDYIFVSYAHRDKEQVMPILEQLQKRGYRLWYDEGIDPGTEWDDYIATRIKRCGMMLALMSRNYLLSDNCKDELNFARDLDKKRLLIYLENVELPLGMAMRLNRLQAIHKYTYPDMESFMEKLLTTSSIGDCCDG